MPRVYLGIGSNVDAENNLGICLRELREHYADIDVSPVYRNKSFGFDGDDFLNLVVGFDTDESLDEVAVRIDAIHRMAGRLRGGQKFASRTLDVDILLYGRQVTSGPIQLPRPDVLEYSFVLKPLADIAPAETHPNTGVTFAEHWRAMESQCCHALTRVDLALA